MSNNTVTVFESIATSWNQEHINYAVAHGLESYPNSLGRDLDILIQSDQANYAIAIGAAIFTRKGYEVVRPPNLWGERLVAFCHNYSNLESTEIHTVTRLSWFHVVFVDYPNPSSYKGNFKVDPWASFVKRVLLPLLYGNVKQFGRKPQELPLDALEREAVSEILPKFFGHVLSRSFLELIEKRDIEGLQCLLPYLRRSLLLRSLILNPLRSLTGIFEAIKRKALQFFLPCAPIIALVGPDGVGKSTVLEYVSRNAPDILTKVIIKHWRPGWLPNLGNLIGKQQPSQGKAVPPRRTPGRFHWLRLAYYFLDFTIGYFMKDRVNSAKQQLILYDRCALDMVVDPVRYGLSSSHGMRLLWRLIPKPDLIILLHDQPQRIRSRKPELEKEEIERQLKVWQQLAKEGKVDAIILVDAPPEEIALRMRDLIVDAFIDINGGVFYPDRKEKNIDWLTSAFSTTDGQVRVQRSKERLTGLGDPKNWETAAEFSFISLGDGRGYLMPLTSRRTVNSALSLYNAQSARARLAKKMLSVGACLGIAQRLLPKVQFAICRKGPNVGREHTFLLEHIKKILGRRDIIFSISLGTSGPYRKPVIQVITLDGKILGYVKVGWNEATSKLVRHETQILKTLAQSLLLSFIVPRVLHNSYWDDHFICIQSAPEVISEESPKELKVIHLGALKELATFRMKRMSLQKSHFWTTLKQRVKRVTNAYYKSVLERGIVTLEVEIGKRFLPFHFRHGDFTPWNTKWVEGRLFIFDWEYASEEASPGWDLFHFLIQSMLLLHRSSIGKIYQAFQEAQTSRYWVERYLKALDLGSEWVRPLLLAYLLDIFSFRVTEDGENTHLLHQLSSLINLLVLKECRNV